MYVVSTSPNIPVVVFWGIAFVVMLAVVYWTFRDKPRDPCVHANIDEIEQAEQDSFREGFQEGYVLGQQDARKSVSVDTVTLTKADDS